MTIKTNFLERATSEGDRERDACVISLAHGTLLLLPFLHRCSYCHRHSDHGDQVLRLAHEEAPSGSPKPPSQNINCHLHRADAVKRFFSSLLHT